MNHRIVALIPLIFLTACGSGQLRTTRLLDHRLDVGLATDVAAGRAVVQDLPDGARVTLLGSTLFPNGARALDDQYPDVRANVIEALLDPKLMQVQVADNSTLPANQRDTRVKNVQQYFTVNGVGGILVPAEADAAGAGPSGLTVTIHVQCPAADGYIGYRDGQSRPVCE